MGSLRVDGTGSKPSNYMKICFIQKPINTIRVLIGCCKFWGPWVHRVTVKCHYKAFFGVQEIDRVIALITL